MKSVLRLFAAAALAAGAGTALAQSVAGSHPDYSVTQAQLGSYYETEPGTGVTQLLGVVDDSVATTTLPFAFTLFGTTYNAGATCYVTSNGWISFTSSANSYGNAVYPTTSNGVCLHGYMEDLYVLGAVKTWVSGTTPNRKWVVSWQNMRMYSGTQGGNVNIQIQVFETTGSVRYSYVTGSGGSWGAYNGVTIGIQGAQTSQWVAPNDPPLGNTGTSFTGQPPHDYSFDNFRITFSGRVLYDRYTVDSAGIGNAQQQNVPLAGFRVEARSASNAMAGVGTTDGNGNFSFVAVGIPPAQVGSLVIVSQTAGAIVRPTASGSPFSATLVSSLSYASNLNVGTISIAENNDPGGVAREPLHIARCVQTAYDWARTRTVKTIAQLPVLYDTSSPATTSYTTKTASSASLRIGSAASGNPDAWDTSVVQKTYGRHVLCSVSADTTVQFDATFDGETSNQNAFAEGFGYYLWSAINVDTNFWDGLTSTTATVIDLEDPTLNTAKSPAVAGWVAAALCDLADDANEAWDPVDGRLVYDRPLLTCTALDTSVTAATFYVQWGKQLGYELPAFSSVMIHHGLIPDDADELNDTAATAFRSSQFGFIRRSRVLNLYNSDWYEFVMPQATNKITASFIYDRTLTTGLTFEIQSATGATLASGAPVGEFGPLEATTGAMPAGTYRVLVRHDSGPPVLVYTVQAYSVLAFSSDKFDPWTVGRPYNVPVAISGGVPPYTLTVEAPFVKPPGLFLDGPNARVTGTPITPGSYGFVLSARDAAEPNNIASGPIDFRVNETLQLALDEFIVFPFDKEISRTVKFTGGTAPFSTSLTEGVLPSGIAVAPGELQFTGKADVPGSYPIAMAAIDVAGSAAQGRTDAVVCVRPGITPLALGRAAAGFYVDAVAGTSVSLSVKTSKGRTKRLLAPRVFGPDGSTSLTVAAKGGNGKASFPGFVAPSTGRFYFVVSSETGEPSELTASAKITAPKSGKGAYPKTDFSIGKLFSIPVGALPGAVLNLSLKPDKSGLGVRSTYLLDPTGAIVPVAAGEGTEKGTAFTLVKTLPTAGTWHVVVVAKPGPSGSFGWSYKIAQPKGAVYSAD